MDRRDDSINDVVDRVGRHNTLKKKIGRDEVVNMLLIDCRSDLDLSRTCWIQKRRKGGHP